MPTKKKRRAPSHTWTDKNGQLYACYTFVDRFGKRKYKYRKAESLAHARSLYQEMKAEHEEKGEESFDARRMTFNDLAAFVREHFVKEPEYRDGLKVAGLRAHQSATHNLAVLCSYFGRRRVRDIGHADLVAYRAERLKTPTVRKQTGGVRKIASVNRELALLRRVLNIAKRQRWIERNPFDGGGLISPASEKKRTRIISRDEEARLLAACEGRQKHLRPVLVCGLDTGMRSGEMFKLRWRDVDLEAGTIHLIAFNTKDAEARDVGMTPRLKAELSELWRQSVQDRDDLVFGITHTMKKGWASICARAGVKGATPHDLRHTCATRMIQAGVPLAEVARVLGHADVRTTFRYVNADQTTHTRAADALHTFLGSDTVQDESSSPAS